MRRWVDAVLGVLLVVFVAVGALRWLDVAAAPVVFLQGMGPFVLIGLVGLTLATTLLRRWWLTLVAGLGLVAALAVAMPSFVSSARPSLTPDLTVLVANMAEGRAEAGQVMDAVRARGVDVLVLLEVTEESVDDLRERGLDEVLTQSRGEPGVDSGTGTMVFSRAPLDEPDSGADDEEGPVQLELTIDLDGTPVAIAAVDVPGPTAGGGAAWRDALRALETWPDEQAGAAVLAGGFSADWGHPGFRALADDLRDAHRTAGLGWVRTWPIVGHRMPPYLQPDHLLSRGLSVVDAGHVAIHGTDHAMVWASYAIEPGD